MGNDDNLFEEGLNDLIDGIDLDIIDTLPKKSEQFVKKVLKDSKGDLVTNASVHDVMHRFVRYARSKGFSRFMILGAFGHGKTEQMCIGYILDAIARNPNILVKLVHVSDEEAVARCRAIRDYITRDEDFHEIAPHIKPTNNWGSKNFIVKRTSPAKDSTVSAYSVLSTAIGGRANLIVFDDPQDLKTAVYEPTTRKRIEDTFKNIWLTRLIPGDSEALLMMNKWHENDLPAIIQRNPAWAWMSIAITEDLNNLVYEDSFGRKTLLPLWELFGKEELKKKKIDLGERDFNRGYRLIPYSDSDKTFPHFSKCCHYGVLPKTIVENESNWFFVAGVDIASTKRPGTILQVVAVHRKTSLKVPVALAVLRKISDLVPAMVQAYKDFGVELYMVENNGVQDAIIDLLITSLGEGKFRKYNLKIEGFQTGSNKADINIGLPSLDREFENNEWMFCYAEEPTIEDDLNLNNWSRQHMEMSNHPFYETTDIVMTTWFCREAAKSLVRGSDGPMIY